MGRGWRWLLAFTVVAGVLFALAESTDPQPQTMYGPEIRTIFAKLQVATRAEAIIRARDAGLGRPSSA